MKLISTLVLAATNGLFVPVISQDGDEGYDVDHGYDYAGDSNYDNDSSNYLIKLR